MKLAIKLLGKLLEGRSDALYCCSYPDYTWVSMARHFPLCVYLDMTTKLSESEYAQTMAGGMSNVTESAEPAVDIWGYVEELVRESVLLRYVLDNYLVESVYRDKAETYDHVLLPTDSPTRFVVLVIDIAAKSIKGHHSLDLQKAYGL